MIRYIFIYSAFLFFVNALAAADLIKFKDESATAGIDHQYKGSWEYFVGGGLATFDCNQDRKPDLFIAGGKSTAKLFINHSSTAGTLSFQQAKLDLSERDLKKVTGAYPLDIDGDGLLDLVLLRVGSNILLKGQENCQFKKMNKAWQFEGGRSWSTAFSAMFEGENTFPTMAFGHYVNRSAPGSPWGTCHDNQFFRPVSSIGTDQKKNRKKQTPDYSHEILLSPGYCALSMLFTDWNKSGEPDLRISNDRHYYRGGEEQLWHIRPGILPRIYTRNEGWRRVTIWGMGIAEGDLDGDGFPEYALTSMGDTKLYTLDEDAEEEWPIYRDIAFERGVTAHRPYSGEDFRPSTGWHAEFADFNNDSRLDLFISKGNVEDMKDFAAFDPDNLLLNQFDGKFVEAGDHAGLDTNKRGRGASVADFNADGLLDLIVVNREAKPTVFRNLGAITPWGVRPAGNWLQLEISQFGKNRHAVGAVLAIKTGNLTQIRKIQVGGGHASGRSGFIHVGLGVAERAEIRIKWPDNSWSAPYRVFANQFALIERDETLVRYWYPEPVNNTP